jgi:hypothetical protein
VTIRRRRALELPTVLYTSYFRKSAPSRSLQKMLVPGFQAAHGRSFDVQAKPAVCRRPHRYVCHGKGRSYYVISTGQVRVEYSQVLSRLTYSRRYRRSAASECPAYPCEYRCQTVRVAEGAISSKTGEFIRNSSGIHPEFIRNSSANQHHLFSSPGKREQRLDRAPSTRASRRATRSSATPRTRRR